MNVKSVGGRESILYGNINLLTCRPHWEQSEYVNWKVSSFLEIYFARFFPPDTNPVTHIECVLHLTCQNSLKSKTIAVSRHTIYIFKYGVGGVVTSQNNLKKVRKSNFGAVFKRVGLTLGCYLFFSLS